MASDFDCSNILHYRHGVSEFLTCLGKNAAAVNAVECVFARQLPAVAVAEVKIRQHETTKD